MKCKLKSENAISTLFYYAVNHGVRVASDKGRHKPIDSIAFFVLLCRDDMLLHFTPYEA